MRRNCPTYTVVFSGLGITYCSGPGCWAILEHNPEEFKMHIKMEAIEEAKLMGKDNIF